MVRARLKKASKCFAQLKKSADSFKMSTESEACAVFFSDNYIKRKAKKQTNIRFLACRPP